MRKKVKASMTVRYSLGYWATEEDAKLAYKRAIGILERLMEGIDLEAVIIKPVQTIDSQLSLWSEENG